MRSGSKPLAVVVALLLAVGLAACGGGGGDGASTAATTSPSTSEASKGGEASIEEFGSEAEGSDRDALTGVFSGYMDALADGDDAKACSYLSVAVQGSLEHFAGPALKGKECVVILPKLLAPTAPQVAREQADGEITRVRVEGDRAFIVFHAPGAKLYQLTMVREDGEWKVASVAASVLVPDLSGVTP